MNPLGNNRYSVVVSGAAGFIGRRVVAALAKAGVQVVAVDRVPVPAHVSESVDFICADLGADPGAIPAADVLVHLAWNMDRTDAAGQAQSAAFFARVLELAKWNGVVSLGTAEEYGELEGRLCEDMAPGRRLSAYGSAKHAACRALQFWACGANRKAVWLRPFVAYGPGQVGNMVIPYALRCAREGVPADFSEGTQSRDFVHVEDVASGIAAVALRLPGMATAFTVCNLGRGEPVRLRDILERIAQQLNAQELFRFGTRPMRPGEPKVQYADVSAAADLFGWRALIPWQKGIDALCRGAAG